MNKKKVWELSPCIMLHLPTNKSQISLCGKSKRTTWVISKACMLWQPSRLLEQLLIAWANIISRMEATTCNYWFRQKHQCTWLLEKKSRTWFQRQTLLHALKCPRYKWSEERCHVGKKLNYSTTLLRTQAHKAKALSNWDLTLRGRAIPRELSSRAQLEI